MNMKELLVVNLDNNLIESIQMNSFFNLTSIRFISMRNNLIKAIFEFFLGQQNQFLMLIQNI